MADNKEQVVTDEGALSMAEQDYAVYEDQSDPVDLSGAAAWKLTLELIAQARDAN